MHRYIIPFIALLLGFGATRSVAQSDAVMDKIAAEACKCAEGKDFKGMAEEERNLTLGMCILGGMEVLTEKEQKNLGLDFSDQASMQSLGEKIGIRMATKCPGVMMSLATTTMTESSSTPKVQTVSGIFQGIETGEYAYLLIKQDDTGQMLKLLWMNDFPGSSMLSDGGARMKGKAVLAGFESTEWYSPKIQDYRVVRIVRSLEGL